MAKAKWVRGFSEIGLGDIALVGGKNASLGELFRNLMGEGVRVPNGFAITAQAYDHHLDANRLRDPINAIIKDLQIKNVEDLSIRAQKIRSLILAAPLPEDIVGEIIGSYDKLCGSPACLAGVAVRSSATAEDLPEASFAGQQETYLNVQGHIQLIDACKKCFASLFTDRAISYRHGLGISHFAVSLSVGVQLMVRSDLACAGVMFSIDTETGFRNAILLNSSYGLGETVVQGSINPDEFMVFKPTLAQGYRPIIKRRLGSKEFKLIYKTGGEKTTQAIPVPLKERGMYSLSDEEILELARWAVLIERHYSQLHGRDIPMDIEWAKDGNDSKLYVVQARPETVQSQKIKNIYESYQLTSKGPVIAQGRSVGSKIGKGAARVIRSIRDLDHLRQGEILITERTDPDWEPVLRRASAIVTDQGGRTCHAAIVSRELGIPAVVGTERATSILETGKNVTVSCAEGDTGFVYEGLLDFKVESVDVSSLSRPDTKMMVNIANPDEVLHLSMLPNDGVGLAREEFIISNHVKIHPMALLRPELVESPEDKRLIAELTQAYFDKTQYFVDRLAEGVAMIAAAFFPKDVVVRFSDFKTNEYAHLLGGSAFEPKEANPMLGFRGASRYYNERYREGFALECRAMLKVRNEMGLKNLKLMIPFCRTIIEAKKVLQEIENNGLKRGGDGLEVYVMCEIPSNIVLADQFADLFDGFSIGSNDLTQLVLGIDRDSDILADLFDERNEAVKAMISQVIQSAKAKGRQIGICGQAPSDFPDFAEFLVQEGIDSISLNADALLKTTQLVLDAETRRISKPQAKVRPPRQEKELRESPSPLH